MAEQQIQIQKTIYSLDNFNNVVNTQFSQLAKQNQAIDNDGLTPDMTVDQFFNEYDILFFDIPPTGSENSHLTLATRSLEYIGLSLDDLQNEISLLREENIDLKNQILLASQIELGTQI
jgi:hypothetical protein